MSMSAGVEPAGTLRSIREPATEIVEEEENEGKEDGTPQARHTSRASHSKSPAVRSKSSVPNTNGRQHSASTDSSPGGKKHLLYSKTTSIGEMASRTAMRRVGSAYVPPSKVARAAKRHEELANAGGSPNSSSEAPSIDNRSLKTPSPAPADGGHGDLGTRRVSWSKSPPAGRKSYNDHKQGSSESSEGPIPIKLSKVVAGRQGSASTEGSPDAADAESPGHALRHHRRVARWASVERPSLSDSAATLGSAAAAPGAAPSGGRGGGGGGGAGGAAAGAAAMAERCERGVHQLQSSLSTITALGPMPEETLELLRAEDSAFRSKDYHAAAWKEAIAADKGKPPPRAQPGGGGGGAPRGHPHSRHGSLSSFASELSEPGSIPSSPEGGDRRSPPAAAALRRTEPSKRQAAVRRRSRARSVEQATGMSVVPEEKERGSEGGGGPTPPAVAALRREAQGTMAESRSDPDLLAGSKPSSPRPDGPSRKRGLAKPSGLAPLDFAGQRRAPSSPPAPAERKKAPGLVKPAGLTLDLGGGGGGGGSGGGEALRPQAKRAGGLVKPAGLTIDLGGAGKKAGGLVKPAGLTIELGGGNKKAGGLQKPAGLSVNVGAAPPQKGKPPDLLGPTPGPGLLPRAMVKSKLSSLHSSTWQNVDLEDGEDSIGDGSSVGEQASHIFGNTPEKGEDKEAFTREQPAFDHKKSFHFSTSGTIQVDGFGHFIRETGIQATRPGGGPGGGAASSSPHDGGAQRRLTSRERLVYLQKLGQGASGIVYSCLDLLDLKIKAVKVIGMSDRGKRRQMTQELAALHRTLCARSPAPVAAGGGGDRGGGGGGPRPSARENLVEFYDAFSNSTDRTAQILMEFMDGGSLQDLVDQGGLTDEGALAEVAYQGLRGLRFLHHSHQIHRDIKPANLLINQRHGVKVTDFGLARQVGGEGFQQPAAASAGAGAGGGGGGAGGDKRAQYAVQRSHAETFVGTLTYMSPERIKGEAYSYPSDVWAFALSLLTCALGRNTMLREDGGYWSVLKCVRDEPAPRLPDDGRWSPEFRGFIAKTLQKDPAARAGVADLLKSDPFVLRGHKLYENRCFESLASSGASEVAAGGLPGGAAGATTPGGGQRWDRQIEELQAVLDAVEEHVEQLRRKALTDPSARTVGARVLLSSLGGGDRQLPARGGGGAAEIISPRRLAEPITQANFCSITLAQIFLGGREELLANLAESLYLPQPVVAQYLETMLQDVTAREQDEAVKKKGENSN